MTFVTKNFVFLAIAAAVVLAAPTMARAQEAPKVRVGFGIGTTAGAIDGEPAINLSVGYRFSKLFSFDGEVAAIDEAPDSFSIRALNFPNEFEPFTRLIPNLGDLSVSTDGSTILATMGFRFEIPTAESRFHPYVRGGMGLARTDQDYDVRILATGGRTPTNAPTSIIADDLTHTGVAFTGGLGADVRVWKGLSVGAEARYFRLDRERNLGTFGGNVSWGF